jgi:predicted ATPase/DNA-binding winged helix-turn-helix (wHTH) protein/class 3 adenylate cyclase
LPQRHRFGRYEIHADERCLLVDGQPTPLGARAFDLLLVLIEHRQRIVSKDELLKLVWPGVVVGESKLHAQISTLRSLLGYESIATIPGRGYRFAMPLDSDPEAGASEPESSPMRDGSPAAPFATAHRSLAAPLPDSGSAGGPPIRKLAAILSADVVGYSRLMADDDQATLEAILATRSVMAQHIARHGGRVIDATGDALLGEFPSALESVRCAIAIQAELAQRNAALPERRRMVMRIGLNVGDVIEQESALYGDGVNVAARLQALGEPGGVCISGSVFDQVDGRLPMRYRFAGEQSVKNIARPVRTYHLEAPSTGAVAHPSRSSGPDVQPTRYRFGRCELRPEQRVLRVDAKPAKLGARAFDVLLALIELRERVVTKNGLLDLVWPSAVVEENDLPTEVSTLRKLLGPEAIETIPGRGYRFAMALEEEPNASSTPVSTETTVVPPTTRLTNLPPAAEALFGRSIDMDALTDLATECRLVTILGAGGIGKTSVAQALARRLVGRHLNGVWWVDLASVASAGNIGLAIANAANLQLGEGDMSASLLRALSPRETLLVLDNCEGLLGDIAQLVEGALAAAPRLRIVATSQETLKVPGEHVYRLEPLAIPTPGAALDEARTFSALQLFEQRARAADRHFSLNASNVAAAIRLCRRLDGVPLAIEMAAARLPLMGLAELEANLGERLRLLKGNTRGAPARHKTLRATLDWSHALLKPEEQAVLRRLAAFAGSFRLDMAQRVAVSEGIDDWAVLDLLAGLVDKSLVQLEQHEPPRYRLLETTRLYAAERLAELHELEAVELRHGRSMALLADEAERAYWVTPDRPWLDRYAPEYDDLQAAFHRACRASDGEVGSATLDALFLLDHLRAIIPPIHSHLQAALGLLQSATPRASARLNLRFAAYFVGGVASVPKLAAATDGVAAFRELGDRWRLYEALMSVAVNCAMVGRFTDAEQALSEADALEDPHWPPRLLWLGASHRSKVHTYRGDAAAYRDSLRAELPLAERAGSPCQAANARLNLADAALMAGDLDEAITLGRAAVEEVRTLDLPQMLAVAQLNLFAVMVRKGDLQSARDLALEALPVIWQTRVSGYFLCHLSLLAAARSRHKDAGQMLGYVEAWFTANQYVREPSEERSMQLASEAVRATLAPSEIASLRQAGALMDEAQAYTLAEGLLLTEVGQSDSACGAAAPAESQAGAIIRRR